MQRQLREKAELRFSGFACEEGIPGRSARSRKAELRHLIRVSLLETGEEAKMALGYHGETCAEAVRASITPGEVIRYSQFRVRIKTKGRWKGATIRRHLMSCIVNLPPARDEWKSREPFLFIRPDGRYELHDSAKHPEVIE